MKKILLLICVFSVFTACKKNVQKSVDEEVKVEETHEEESASDYSDLPVLVGKQEITAIQNPPYSDWFLENYKYMPKSDVLEQLKPALVDKTFEIFMGNWCSDSRAHVPALMNILDAVGYDSQNITLITVDEDKTTPENWEEGKNIQFVPTIILYENGVEKGRIVEYPIQNLEEDLLKIATGQPYKHAYED